MGRDELLQELRDSGTEALAAMLAVPERALDTGGYEQGWTVRQIMAHVASMEYTYRRLPDIARGPGNAQATADGGRFDMDGYNARQVAKRASATPAELRDEFIRGRAALITLVSGLDDELLAVPVRSAGGIGGTLAEVLRATAAGHVRGHSADFARAAGAAPTPADRAAAALLIAAAEAALLVESVADDQWRKRPSPQDWSAAGIAGHLIEIMPYWANTLTELASRPSALFGRDLDTPERLGAVVDGEAMTPVQASEAVHRAAGEAAALLRRLRDTTWDRAVQHRRYGEMTLAQAADRLLIQHAREHLRHLAEVLAATNARTLSG